MEKRIKVSAVMPVFNEDKTVEGVIRILINSPLIDEVIVVNDGSGDDSLKIINQYKNNVRVVSLKVNRGKGWAVAKGVSLAKGELILLTDADLVNFSNMYIKKLLDPIKKNGVIAVVGYLKKGKYLPAPFSRLTGERVYYKKDLLPLLKDMRVTRFGLEIFLNHLFKDKAVKRVPLVKLKGLYKYEKFSTKTAVREYLGEGLEIAKELAKQEKLMPADLKIIEKLRKVSQMSEWKEKVKKISNQKIKKILLKYIVRYFKKTEL